MLEKLKGRAAAAANETGKPHAVYNLNRYAPLYVVREYKGGEAEFIAYPDADAIDDFNYAGSRHHY